MRFRGKDGLMLRVIAIYRPCDSRGESTVAAQHRTFLLNEEIDENPRQVFLDDLSLEITEWRTTGDQLIITGDINDDIRSPLIQTMFASHDMHETILSLHPEEPPLATFIANHQHKVIDGIWVSRGIQPVRAGYTPFGDFDHRTPWIDIIQQSVFGHKILPTSNPNARRLQLRLPKVVHNYQTLYVERTSNC